LAEVRSDTSGAERYATEALQQSQLREAPGLIADAQLELASAEMHTGKYEEARQHLTIAISGYQALGNPHGEVEARRALAGTFASLQRTQDARDEYQRAMGLAQNIGDQGAVSAVYRDICESLWLNGDRDGAQAAARRALDISRETGDLRLQAWTLRALATIASDDAETDEVMSEYREVTALTERSNDVGGHVWSLATNIDAFRIRGQLEEAKDSCRRAQSEAAALSDPQFMTYSLFNCALLEIDLGEPDAARRTLSELVNLTQKSANSAYEANAHLALGQLDFEASNFARARQELEISAQKFAADDSQTGEAEARAMLALCEQAMGDSAARDVSLARAKQLRTAITSRQEVFVVEIAVAQLTTGAQQRADAVSKLRELAADAERRQFLSWSLEAQLAAWQMLRLDGQSEAADQLRNEVEAVARKHGFRRVLNLMSTPPVVKPAGTGT
jgi:tetratricopeptide (TPR) repeat protein